MPDIYRTASLFPRLFNLMAGNVFTGSIIKGIMGFSAKRSIPSIAPQSLASRIKTIKGSESRGQVSRPVNHDAGGNGKAAGKSLYLFIDEFSNFTDVSAGFAAYALLTGLGYNVLTVKSPESGRTSISKGLIRRAKKIAEANVMLYSGLINGDVPLVGIEPSSILTFRDEYVELTGKPVREKAVALAANCYMIEEFIAREFSAGNISSGSFTKESRKILYHGHCQQKAIASTSPAITILNIPENYTATEIASGCCGMAGSFGFEKRHYELSMNIGELVLFPAIRKADNNTIISASGTSCRQQILDGTSRKAMHPVEVLYDAFIK
jgi:Fe-S oxidoreductase